MAIRLVVGLGNPGDKYDPTRHNAGFWFCDRSLRQPGFSAESWSVDGPHQALTCKLRGPAGLTALLVKPQTFMNRSGLSVGGLARYFRIEPDEILIAHDELDLLPGEIRLKKGGGHAGHNGLRDIAQQLGSTDTWRLRIGIGHPRSLGLAQQVADFVLHRPSAEESRLIDDALARALGLLARLLADPMVAQRELNKAASPPATKLPASRP